MSVYGIDIIRNNGRSSMSSSSNVFFLDYFYPKTSGSKSYHLVPGETLEVTPVYYAHYDEASGWEASGPSALLDTFSVSGNTLTWKVTPCTDTFPYPRFFGYSVLMVYKRGTS